MERITDIINQHDLAVINIVADAMYITDKEKIILAPEVDKVGNRTFVAQIGDSSKGDSATIYGDYRVHLINIARTATYSYPTETGLSQFAKNVIQFFD